MSLSCVIRQNVTPSERAGGEMEYIWKICERESSCIVVNRNSPWPWLWNNLFVFIWSHFFLILYLILSLYYLFLWVNLLFSPPLLFFFRWAMSLHTHIWGSLGCLPACSRLPPENRAFPFFCYHWNLHLFTINCSEVLLTFQLQP